jgi:predicted lipid-binding transport protein (Tim44 family)
MHTSDPRTTKTCYHCPPILPNPPGMAGNASPTPCTVNGANRRSPGRLAHMLGWLAGNLLVGLLYLLYRFSRF